MATGRDRDVNCERRGWEQGEIGMGLPPGRDGDGNWGKGMAIGRDGGGNWGQGDGNWGEGDGNWERWEWYNRLELGI